MGILSTKSSMVMSPSDVLSSAVGLAMAERVAGKSAVDTSVRNDVFAATTAPMSRRQALQLERAKLACLAEHLLCQQRRHAVQVEGPSVAELHPRVACPQG